MEIRDRHPVKITADQARLLAGSNLITWIVPDNVVISAQDFIRWSCEETGQNGTAKVSSIRMSGGCRPVAVLFQHTP